MLREDNFVSREFSCGWILASWDAMAVLRDSALVRSFSVSLCY